MPSTDQPLRFIKLSLLELGRRSLGAAVHPGLGLLRALTFVTGALLGMGTVSANMTPLEMTAIYARHVDKRLDMPDADALSYGQLALTMLAQANIQIDRAQYVVLVDRNPMVQAVMVFSLAAGETPRLIGASPTSTGRQGAFEYFETPTGVFDNSLSNPDFRAEGTKNEFGIRGYGVKGMRVYDFGWQQATRGWGGGGTSTMRLQLHATDPDILERRLGSVQSKGCIRIPASLNRLIDQYGLLDADYERGLAEGKKYWLLLPQRTPVSTPGRYMIVVDTQRKQRPAWSPKPNLK